MNLSQSMNKKIRVGLLFGGTSIEHEVSLQSAKNVLEALDPLKYDPVLIGIDKGGKWSLYSIENYLVNAEDPKKIALLPNKKVKEILSFKKAARAHPIDVIFPVLHGTFGEDGTVQGLLKLVGIPFVGAGVLGSAIGMDKDVMKRLCREAGIRVAHFICIPSHQRSLWSFKKVAQEVGLPFFVKPANAGSSIGISKVKEEAAFEKAIELAFQYDRKILIEEAIVGREIECSVIGNEAPLVSLPCEIVPKGEFHSYSSKYIDPNGADFIIPVSLEKEELAKVQSLALKAYAILGCEGLARVDMFLTKKKEVVFNEINTIPGLTNQSPYLKMWHASGMSSRQVMDLLIQLAFERFEKEKSLQIEYNIEEIWVKN